jgi:hypothetical protein
MDFLLLSPHYTITMLMKINVTKSKHLFKCFVTLKTLKVVRIKEICIHIDVGFRFIDDLFALLSDGTWTLKNIEEVEKFQVLTQETCRCSTKPVLSRTSRYASLSLCIPMHDSSPR